ncbi:MAG: hypothetical protein ABIN91_08045 [Mucilaginibacter sp.]|uniref:hypothetical protein n=1 Tax=Mucilaginibacter sp. TaxID=1882438 RepID=UPI003267F78C
MRNNLYTILFIAIAFSACSKSGTDTYITSSRSSTTTSSTTTTTITSSRGNAPGSGSTTTPTPVYDISFNNGNQVVKVSVNNKTLTMNLHESINLLIRKDSLAKSFSIIFKEDFKSIQLGKYSYTTLSKDGTITTNYAENNLNNVTISGTKDTTMNSVVYTKISFNRNFIFTGTFNTSTEAGVQYDYLLNNKETIYFSSYMNTTTGVSATVKSSSTLVYTSN